MTYPLALSSSNESSVCPSRTRAALASSGDECYIAGRVQSQRPAQNKEKRTTYLVSSHKVETPAGDEHQRRSYLVRNSDAGLSHDVHRVQLLFRVNGMGEHPITMWSSVETQLLDCGGDHCEHRNRNSVSCGAGESVEGELTRAGGLGGGCDGGRRFRMGSLREMICECGQ